MAASEATAASEFGFFDGSVDDAIKKIKNDKTCLLVYVYGEDDTSKKYDAYFSSGGKLTQLAGKFVCMRLSGQSDTAMQFSAFYPVVSLPTIYLISPDGVSLEALIGDRTEDDLVARLATAAPNVPAAGADADWDSRVARIEEKIEVKQAEKAREAADKERQSERDRRSVGRSMHQLRQQQQADQERAWAEEVRQERMARYREQQQKKSPQQQSSEQPQEEDSAAEALREFRQSQSAAYEEKRRSEEAARRAAADAAEAAEREAAAAADAERRRTARLQLRCPDGGVFVRELSSDATLAQLLESVSGAPELARSRLQGRKFRLATVYPRRVFDNRTESGSTLAELELAPSASLLVLPPVDGAGASGVGRGGSGGGAVNTALSVVTKPLVLLSRLLALLLGFLGALFGGGGGGGVHQQQRPPPPASSASSSAGAARRLSSPGGGATVERQGNTARLRNLPRGGSAGGRGRGGANPDDEDDDDGATWNGNSTQQM